MGDKNLLISSMQKLINHVKKSAINQQQIFYSLSRNDFKKILTNLQQTNQMLRKISLNLIAQLLSNNNKLKNKFCKTMQINLIPGKILFNSKIIDKYIKNFSMKALLGLLKKQPSSSQYQSFIWFINLTKPLQIQFIYKDQNKSNNKLDIDPQQCLVGFCISSQQIILQNSTTNLSITNNSVNDNQKKNKLKNLIQVNPKNVILYAGQKVHSSMSQNQPKYQRMNKSIQFQTERPKKLMSTYQTIKRTNVYKGNQTQRLSINQVMQNNYVKRDSFQIQKTRPSMPVKIAQNPYIPTLHFDNNSFNMYTLKTDRVSQSNASNGNRPKQFDFQKVKYNGIKVTTNQHNSYIPPFQNSSMNNSLNGSININGFKPNQKRGEIIENNYKYIKPMTTTHNQQGVKYISFFHKKSEQIPIRQKKTIDVFQYIKNR